MDREISEFFIQFTAKGFSDVSDKIDSLSKKMDELGTASEKATEKHKGFFSGIGGWIASLGLITAAVGALKKAWDGVAEVSAKTMELQWNALYSGTAPETIERWQNVARRKYSETAMGDIAPSFNSLYKFLWNFSMGQVPGEEFNKKIGLALQGTIGGAEIQNAIMDSVNAGNANALLGVLNKYFSSGVIGSQAKQSILDAFGINNATMLGLLSFETLPQMLAEVPTNKSKEENVINSAKYTEARAKLKEATEDFWFRLQPAVTRLITWFTNTGVPQIEKFIDTYWPKIESGVKLLFEWLMKKLGVLIEKFGDKNTRSTWDKIKNTVIGAGAGFAAGATTGVLAGGVGTLPLAVGGAILGGVAGYKSGDMQDPWATWANLTPEEQFSLFSKDASFDNFAHNARVPSGVLESNNRAVAIVNIDGHEVAKNESGNISMLDYTSPINIPTVER